jgi:hypothetical protein
MMIASWGGYDVLGREGMQIERYAGPSAVACRCDRRIG